MMGNLSFGYHHRSKLLIWKPKPRLQFWFALLVLLEPPAPAPALPSAIPQAGFHQILLWVENIPCFLDLQELVNHYQLAYFHLHLCMNLGQEYLMNVCASLHSSCIH
ncbi:hypothetical protein V8G54_005979 [Vigna mungo]|uniref:Uncharacterized protein n=1 Tax=Vigna mungo TaxID=3915 RepID=A0AAQ3P120_VIGMU